MSDDTILPFGFPAVGGKKASTPKQAAGDQDFVMMCVGNDNDVREVTLGANGAFELMDLGEKDLTHLIHAHSRDSLAGVA